jgi:uncharacterized metal-binding protein YceD (DUF177 family)
MMVIDVRKLNTLRKYNGELHFEVAANQNLVTVPMAEMISPIEVKGEYEIFTDDSVEIKGKARYLLRGACTRCLKRTEKWIEVEWDPCFVKGESDGETYHYDNDTLSLDQSVEDAVLLGMPYSFLCDEECKGIEYDHRDEE